MMREVFFALTVAAHSYAATTVYLDPATETKGGTLKTNLHWNPPQPVTSVAMQFTITYDASDFTSISITPGKDITLPNKNLTCVSGNGTLSCAVWAMSDTPIAVGYSLGTVTMKVSANAHSTSAVSITNPLAEKSAIACCVTGRPDEPFRMPAAVVAGRAMPSGVTGGTDLLSGFEWCCCFQAGEPRNPDAHDVLCE